MADIIGFIVIFIFVYLVVSDKVNENRKLLTKDDLGDDIYDYFKANPKNLLRSKSDLVGTYNRQRKHEMLREKQDKYERCIVDFVRYLLGNGYRLYVLAATNAWNNEYKSDVVFKKPLFSESYFSSRFSTKRLLLCEISCEDRVVFVRVMYFLNQNKHKDDLLKPDNEDKEEIFCGIISYLYNYMINPFIFVNDVVVLSTDEMANGSVLESYDHFVPDGYIEPYAALCYLLGGYVKNIHEMDKLSKDEYAELYYSGAESYEEFFCGWPDHE